MSQTQDLSSPWLPESPAFLGFHPPKLNWLSVELQPKKMHQAWWDLADKIQFPISIDAVFKLESHHQEPFGFYRVLGCEAETSETFDWFIKVVSPVQAQRQKHADNIAQFVSSTEASSSKSEVFVSNVLPGFPQQLNGYGILAYEYKPGRFLQPNNSDLNRLAESLATLHLKLEHCPNAHQVKQLGLQRQQVLKQRLEFIQSGIGHAEEIKSTLPEAVKYLLVNYRADYLDVLIENAQCIHGDLNVGNVWLTESNQLTFLDFEDSLTAWFNPLKDLVFVLERFVFTHAHADEKHIQLAKEFIQTYYQYHNHRLNSAEHMQQLLQALAVRALLLLIEVAKESGSEMTEEWQKFVYLYELADEQSTIFTRLFLEVK